MAPGSDGRNGPERRGFPRLRVPEGVRFSGEGVDGKGLIEDLSLSGIQVVDSDHIPEPGTLVELSLTDEAGSDGLVARGEVVRKTADGFAVRFTRISPGLQSALLNAVREMVVLEQKS